MDIDLSVLKFIEREKEIPFNELVSIIEAAILSSSRATSARSRMARPCLVSRASARSDTYSTLAL
jgi:hypothetical protein